MLIACTSDLLERVSEEGSGCEGERRSERRGKETKGERRLRKEGGLPFE